MTWRLFLLFLFPILAIFLTPLSQAFADHAYFLVHFRMLIALLLLVAVALSLLLGVLALRLERISKAHWIYHGIFLVWLAVHLLYFFLHVPVLLEATRSQIPAGIAALAMGTLAVVATRSRKPLVVTAYVSIPLLLEISAGFLSLRLFEIPVTPKAPLAVQNNPIHIFHLIFDTLGFADQEGKQFEESLLRLSKHHGLSAHLNHFVTAAPTYDSIPDLLRVDRSKAPPMRASGEGDNHIFKALHDKGFRVAIYGEYLPYCLRFAEWAHVCKNRQRALRALSAELGALAFLHLGAVSPRIGSLLGVPDSTRYLDDSPHSSLGLFNEFLDELPRSSDSQTSTYTLVHVMLPHAPFVLDGECHPLGADAPSDENVRYRLQSRCSFHLADTFLTRLKNAGIYDRSRIVIHSDHGKMFDGWHTPVYSRALSSSEVTRISHTPLWTKGLATPTPRLVTELTSSASIAGFVLNPQLEQLPRQQSVQVNFRERTYSSEDGRNWREVGTGMM